MPTIAVNFPLLSSNERLGAIMTRRTSERKHGKTRALFFILAAAAAAAISVLAESS